MSRGIFSYFALFLSHPAGDWPYMGRFLRDLTLYAGGLLLGVPAGAGGAPAGTCKVRKSELEQTVRSATQNSRSVPDYSPRSREMRESGGGARKTVVLRGRS
jgi:hypothetical protein